MTQVGSVYGEALYDLARSENLSETILKELTVLSQSFTAEPDFIRLLGTPSLSMQERCQILDDSFRDKVHPYVLNFLKILTEKGYMQRFSDCCKEFRQAYNEDHGILEVFAYTAIELTADQKERLSQKLHAVTGKTIDLINRVDPSCLGGVRLDYDGKRVDDTVEHRLGSISALLKNTVL